MECNKCENNAIVESNVPYVVVEEIWTKSEARQKRFIVALVAVVITFVLCFTAFAMYSQYLWSQFDYVDETPTVDIDSKDGTANYVGRDGDINNGKN